MPLSLINPITYTDTQANSVATSVATTIATTQASLVVPAGTIIASSLHVRPTGFLECDGSNTVSRTTYSNLFNAIVPNKGTVTITIATPGIVTLNTHNFLTGESIYLNTTGSLPTGLSVDILYYIVTINANTFSLATSYANAIAGTSITTSGTQSGVHTLFYCPYGLGNDTSNFKLPDLKNATIRGRGLSTGFTSNGTTRMGYLENDSFQGHYYRHGTTNSTYVVGWDGTGGTSYDQGVTGGSSGIIYSLPQALQSDGTNGTPRAANETRMKNQGVNFFIKF